MNLLYLLSFMYCTSTYKYNYTDNMAYMYWKYIFMDKLRGRSLKMSSLTAWSQCDGRWVKLPQTPVPFYNGPKFKFLKRLGHQKFFVEGLIDFCIFCKCKYAFQFFRLPWWGEKYVWKFLLASFQTLTNFKVCSENGIRISVLAFLRRVTGSYWKAGTSFLKRDFHNQSVIS
jgi:hypothetical protein